MLRCSEESKVMQAGQTSGEVAEEAARAAGALIVERVGAEVLRSKAFESDLVTEVDQCCEEVIREIVQKHLPGHAFLGEESAGSSMESLLNTEGWLWVVDPLDGTTNFASGQPMSAVSICAARHGQPRAAAGGPNRLAGGGSPAVEAAFGGGFRFSGAHALRIPLVQQNDLD
ncbi:unnamed protein product [Effrenium voratum]|nr:unnamed protein product [Effrenium voratum]